MLSVLIGGMLAAGPASAQAHTPVQVAVPLLASATAPLVFRGVTVIDVRDGQRLPNRTVTVIGNRIRTIAVAGKASVPKGARVVDARGKYLIPGLWDMHVHVQKFSDLAYPLLVAHGVTGVRDAGSEVPLATLGQWKRDIASGARVGPRFLVSGPAINEGDSGHGKVVQDDYQFVRVPSAELPRVVDSLRQAGADFIKTSSLSRDGYFAAAAAARRLGIPFGGHVPADRNSGARGIVGGLDASDSGATFLDHEPYLITAACGGGNPNHIDLDQCVSRTCGGGDVDSFNVIQCQAVAAHYRRNNSWITVPAQTKVTGLRGQMDGALSVRTHRRVVRFLPHSFASFAGWSKRSDSMEAIPMPFREPTATADWVGKPETTLSHRQEAGLPLLVGTDMNLLPVGWYDAFTPGFVQHEALLGFVLAGMTPLAALQTATLNPALALRATDSLGTVAAGKLADMVLLDADPLIDIWNTTKIRAVVTNGHYYDRAALDQLLLQAEQVAARQ